MPNKEASNQIRLDEAVINIGSGLSLTKGRDNLQPKNTYTIDSVGAGHSVSYGSLNTPPAGTSAGQVYHQTSTGTSSGVLMNTWTFDGVAWFNESQPINVTRTQLVNLRNAGQLRQSQHYLITDHVQGRLVAGTTILVHATADNEISESVTVNTTYDNEGWRGIYDMDRALVLELQDNRNNIARGINGTEVSNFDWGNVAYTNVIVDNATLTVTIGNTAIISHVTVEKQATLNLTGFLGTMSNSLYSTVALANFTNANGTWRMNVIKGQGTFNASGYTGGGDNYYNEINGNNTINFSNSSSQVVFRQNEISASSTITHSGVSTGTFTLIASKIMNSNITHSQGAGNFTTLGNCYFLSGSSVLHSTGVMNLTNVHNVSSLIQQSSTAGNTLTLNQVNVKQGSTITNAAIGTLSILQTTVEMSSLIQRQAGGTGNLTINYSNISQTSNISHLPTNTGATTINNCNIRGGSSISHSSSVIFTGTRLYLKSVSTITAQSGSGGAITLSDTEMLNGSITKLSSSIAGTLTVNSATKLESGGFIQMAGTGNLTITQSHIIGSSGINVTAGDRNYTFTRFVQTGVSRANLSGTGSTITDTHTEFEMHYRGGYNNSCSGTSNTISYSECTGLSGIINLTGTTGGSNLNRIKIKDGSFIKNNNPNAGTYQIFNISDAGVMTLSNHANNESINYIDLSNSSFLTINRTGLGTISAIQIRNGGTANILGTSTTINKLDIEQGVVTINAGSISNLSKKMNSTLTINAGLQSNVLHCSSVNKTATVANTNRADYLGLVSSAPIL